MEHKFLSLIWLVFMPLIPIGLILSPLIPRNPVIIRRFSKWFAGIHLLYTYSFLLYFNPNLLLTSFKDEIKFLGSGWINTMGISSAFAVDGFSLLLCVLTTFIFFIALIVSKYTINTKHKFYYTCVFFLEMSVLGIFCARDMFFMFLFLVLSTIPLYFLISIFGNSKKEADKFLIINNIGNMLILFGILTVYYYNFSISGILTANLDAISFDELACPIWLQITTFICFMLGFGTRFNFFPLHMFFSKIQENSPMPINIILSSVILNIGAYGIMEYAMRIFPTTFKTLALLLMITSVLGIIHCAMSAYVQKNIKRLLFYISAAFVNFVILGFSTVTTAGLTGAIFMIIAHSLVFCALYLITGIIYLRTKTLNIEELSGISKQMKRLTYFAIPICFAAIGLPFMIFFPAEIMIIFGAFSTELLDEISFQTGGIISVFSLIIIAIAVIKFLHTIFFGNFLTKFSSIKDTSVSEFISLLGITLPILIFGLIPSSLINIYDSVVLITIDILRI